MNGENKKKHQEHYQKNREYFLSYYQDNKSRRKYNFCVVCGRNNENNKYIKVCSKACSLTLRRSTMQGAVRDFYKRKEQETEKLNLIKEKKYRKRNGIKQKIVKPINFSVASSVEER